MRLSYCYPAPERIREGVRRLAGVVEQELELRETFGRTVVHFALGGGGSSAGPGAGMSGADGVDLMAGPVAPT